MEKSQKKQFISNFRRNSKLTLFPKRWALYLKIWASYGNFCESRLGEISISQNLEILKSHSIFEIFAQFACGLNFQIGPTYIPTWDIGLTIKNGHYFWHFYRHLQWTNNILMVLNDQAEMNGTSFASWNTCSEVKGKSAFWLINCVSYGFHHIMFDIPSMLVFGL